jgi:hypothetical protein
MNNFKKLKSVAPLPRPFPRNLEVSGADFIRPTVADFTPEANSMAVVIDGIRTVLVYVVGVNNEALDADCFMVRHVIEYQNGALALGPEVPATGFMRYTGAITLAPKGT